MTRHRALPRDGDRDAIDDADRRAATAAGRDDVERERYRELLEELRTVMPGVQVLFGFLLVAPFSARFPDLDDVGTVVFTSTLVTTALATVVFVAPAPYHRLRGHRDRHERVRDSVRFQLIGIGLLGLATVQAIFVITRFIAGTLVAGLLAGLVAVAVVGTWGVLPHLRRRS